MSTLPDHEHFAELAAGYALRALEPAEEHTFAAHLKDCPECQREVASHTDTLGHLAYATEPFALPAGILAGIRAEITAAPAPTAACGPAELASPPAPAERAISAAVEPALPAPESLAAARVRRSARALAGRNWVGLAAAAALILSLGVWNINLHQAKSQDEIRASRLSAAVATLEHGAKQRVQLSDQLGHPVAVAVVGADETVSLVVDGLVPNNRSTSTYVLWQKGAYGVVRPVAAFDVRPGINVVTDLPLARDVVGVQEFAVTQELGRRPPASPRRAPVAEGLVA
ncbi:MAG: hypothetical protein NVS3B26_21550 [Mycobacteriales bacterium]